MKAVAENEGFADFMKPNGMHNSSQAISVMPRNEAAVAFMFNSEEETWRYQGKCEEVPLLTYVMLKTRQACSDTGPTFVSFFDDVGILQINPL